VLEGEASGLREINISTATKTIQIDGRRPLPASPSWRNARHSAFVLRDLDGNRVTVNSSHVVGDG
jgi:hypothetical protein